MHPCNVDAVSLNQEYVLGTHDDEIERLGLQHRAWRPSAFAGWQAAGITLGQTVLDVGCGPGYASLDLAETVGPRGRVVAIDKSERFLSTLKSAQRPNITMYRADLESGDFPEVQVDRVWCRWVLCFVKNPREILANMAAALQPGGALVLHEYFDYCTWKASPSCPELDEYVKVVMKSWRDAGGEPDISRQILHWLGDLGLEVRRASPILNMVEPGSMLWTWLRTFIEVGRLRLREIGYLSNERCERIWEAFTAFEAEAGSRMFTPGVLEIIARGGRK